MPLRITRDLLRKKSEHNDGQLSNLKEIALHQLDLESLDGLDHFCRDLEIVLAQSNLIARIEGVSKLKALRYLNLALNNVSSLAGLEGCESLVKLDLTVNFIADLNEVSRLKCNEYLNELYLVGNPCSTLDGYREFVVSELKALKLLDGREVTKSERIEAGHVVPELSKDALIAPQSGIDESTDESAATSNPDDLEQRRQDFQSKPIPFTPASRIATAIDVEDFRGKTKDDAPKETAEQKAAREAKQAEEKARKQRRYYSDDGRVFQCNEGKYAFKFTENAYTIHLSVSLPKHLDSSLVHVDALDSRHIRLLIKSKALQLCFDQPIATDDEYAQRDDLVRAVTPGMAASLVVCERSRATGSLDFWFLKRVVADRFYVSGGGADEGRRLELEESSRSAKDRKMMEEEERRKREEEDKAKQAKGVGVLSKRLQKLGINSDAGKVDWKNIVSDEKVKIVDKKVTMADMQSKMKEAVGVGRVEDPSSFVDDPDVPPLC